jgi:hypothetical protein
MSGKSEFALNLVKYRDDVYSSKFERILYCLPDSSIHLHQNFIGRLREACESIEIIEGLPDVEKLHLKVKNNFS